MIRLMSHITLLSEYQFRSHQMFASHMTQAVLSDWLRLRGSLWLVITLALVTGWDRPGGSSLRH